ncbi:hypothetical protein [Paenibacillus sp. JJ-100]|uniref:hypothetical protein n=1 Tax=Paenibacillus sp. JJ-100 TaxID=2974896 RepID=UPI00232CEC7A|nr:hypothetical protein [Paenibacillus sp. JJ-100]
MRVKLAPWTLNKRDIHTVPAFLWEGGDGLLSLGAPLLQKSTVVPFEGKVKSGMRNGVDRKNP